jgi:hypothetical protein
VQDNALGVAFEIVFYGLQYTLIMVLSLVSALIGIYLIREHVRSKNKGVSSVVWLAVLLISTLVGNVLRLLVASLTWIRTIALNGAAVSFVFPGLPVYLRFEGYGAAVIFYLFVFVFPDTIPAFCTLLILLRGRIDNKRSNEGVSSDAEVPLLSEARMEGVRKRYEI